MEVNTNKAPTSTLCCRFICQGCFSSEELSEDESAAFVNFFAIFFI